MKLDFDHTNSISLFDDGRSHSSANIGPFQVRIEDLDSIWNVISHRLMY
jgi:hypothetical protein